MIQHIHTASFSGPTLALLALQSCCASGSEAQWLPVLVFAVLQDIAAPFISHLLIKLTPVHPPSLPGIKVAALRKTVFSPLPHNTLYIPPPYLIVVVSRLSDFPGFASHLHLEGASACS